VLLADRNWHEHPGVFLKEELDERSLTELDLANIVDCPVESIHSIIDGTRGISPEISKPLGQAFSVSIDFFSNLQRYYEISLQEKI